MHKIASSQTCGTRIEQAPRKGIIRPEFNKLVARHSRRIYVY
jgi:hypothetical protein